MIITLLCKVEPRLWYISIHTITNILLYLIIPFSAHIQMTIMSKHEIRNILAIKYTLHWGMLDISHDTLHYIAIDLATHIKSPEEAIILWMTYC